MRIDYLQYIPSYPDFPKPGIIFRDIFPLVGNPQIFKSALKDMAELAAPFKPNKILSIEARGFIIGAALSLEMDLHMLPARKKGKLPGEILSYEYQLEYGTDVLQIPQNTIQKGDRVLIADDVLATGGTAEAAMEVIKLAGGTPVALISIMELRFLKGRERLQKNGLPTVTLIEYNE